MSDRLISPVIASKLPVTRTAPTGNTLPVHGLRTGNVPIESECGFRVERLSVICPNEALANDLLTSDKLQVQENGRLESRAETRDDYAGMDVGRAMLKTTQAGKSGNYADLYDQIRNILCE